MKSITVDCTCVLACTLGWRKVLENRAVGGGFDINVATQLITPNL